MRKIFALLTIASLTIASCSDDDNSNNNGNGIENPYTGSVVGTWSTVALYDNGQPVNLACDIPNPAEDNYTFKFLDNGTFDLYYNCDFDPVLTPVASGTYTTTGNVLRLNLDGAEGRAHMIDNLNQDRLRFRFNIGSSGLFYGYEFVVADETL